MNFQKHKYYNITTRSELGQITEYKNAKIYDVDDNTVSFKQWNDDKSRYDKFTILIKNIEFAILGKQPEISRK